MMEGAEKGERAAGSPRPNARLKPVVRNQYLLRPVNVEQLVPQNHPVRAIWVLAGELDLSAFHNEIAAVEGRAGQCATDPRLLMSLWVYAYSRGINSAREISRHCDYDPPFQWLTGLQPINHHTLSDFRAKHGAALDEVFAQLLAVLSYEELITLDRVAHDGTKIRAAAGAKSYRGEKTLEEHLDAAREEVERMRDTPCEELNEKRARARERAAREKQARIESAVEQLQRIQEEKSDKGEVGKVRVSTSDPDARIMKESDGGFAPAYNVQISTDAEAGIVIGVGVSQSATDIGELIPAVDRIEDVLGERPKQVLVDGGFTDKENIEEMARRGIDLIGSMTDTTARNEAALKKRGIAPEFHPRAFTYDEQRNCYVCPAGRDLPFEGRETKGSTQRYRYRGKAADCLECPNRQQCCPGAKRGRSIVRSIDSACVQAFQEKMQTPEAKELYKQRAPLAEFPNAWIKEKLGLRKFRLRGLAKVRLEALWACLTYNVMQWIRLRWRPKREASPMYAG